MLKFQFAKLVRDKIVDHQIASGAKPRFRRLGLFEHKQALVNKIIEEAREIIHASPKEVASEIADVQQAVDDLKELYNLTDEDIVNAQVASTNKNGAFKKGILVEYVEIDAKDPWVDYYRKNPERYPEVE